MEPGEFVTQMPVLQIGDLSRMVCIAEVYEADVKEIEIGQTATIHSPALSGEYRRRRRQRRRRRAACRARCVRIGTLVSSAGLIQRNPLAPSDRSIVEVLIEIVGKNADATAAATAEAARHIGLQVTVKFGEKPGEPAAERADRTTLARTGGETPMTGRESSDGRPREPRRQELMPPPAAHDGHATKP